MKVAAFPQWIEPMKATLTTSRFSGKEWQFEPKLDGVRCLAFVQKGKVRLLSRNQLAMNETYPEIVDALKTQALKSFVLDGEIVAFRPNSSVTSFEVLQQRLGIHRAAEARESSVKVYFYVFDLLHAEGRDLRGLPLIERQTVLRKFIQFIDPLRETTHVLDKGEAYYAEACRNGWEGLIAKRSDSRYHSGRSSEWLKFKCIQEQEFVIGGYSDPEGARDHFGALLLGYYDKGKLRYAGKVGTGFSQSILQRMASAFKSIARKDCPFSDLDIPRRDLHWVNPILVAQIGFAEWTQDGKLRQPRFVGLRADKEPADVTREKPIPQGDPHGRKKSRA